MYSKYNHIRAYKQYNITICDRIWENRPLRDYFKIELLVFQIWRECRPRFGDTNLPQKKIFDVRIIFSG